MSILLQDLGFAIQEGGHTTRRASDRPVGAMKKVSSRAEEPKRSEENGVEETGGKNLGLEEIGGKDLGLEETGPFQAYHFQIAA